MEKDEFGEILNDPITNYIETQANDFLMHINNNICQRCGKKGDNKSLIGLDSNPHDEEEYMYESFVSDMVVLCSKCRDELKDWLNIPSQDSL